VVVRLIFRRYVSSEIQNFVASNTLAVSPGADSRKKLTRCADFTTHPIHAVVCTGDAVVCRLIFSEFGEIASVYFI